MIELNHAHEISAKTLYAGSGYVEIVIDSVLRLVLDREELIRLKQAIQTGLKALEGEK